MQKFSLEAVAQEQLDKATAAATGRSAATVYGGHEQVLRQTVLALAAGTTLSEHENPGEATLFVLRGRVRLRAGGTAEEGRGGDLLVIPPERHSLEALEDAVVLLTVGKSAVSEATATATNATATASEAKSTDATAIAAE